ncbi:MAG: hypothetical protein PHV18_03870 [Lachnospiraceae bacterium]|nr:hypothetical protein [Lachnospiraceae bacterium]
MDDKETRATRVLVRVRELRIRRENRVLAGLSAICTFLAITLAGAYSVLVNRTGEGIVSGLYGANLLLEGGGGYVLMGVVSFAAAVLITVVWTRNREKKQEKGMEKRRKRG